MSSCFSRCLRVPIAIRAFYESYLWILQPLSFTQPDLHPGLLGHRVADVQRLRMDPSFLAAPESRADRRCWDLSTRFLVLWHNPRNRRRPEYQLDCCGSNAGAELDPNSASS